MSKQLTHYANGIAKEIVKNNICIYNDYVVNVFYKPIVEQYNNESIK